MLTLRKVDRYEILLTFDAKGAEELISALQELDWGRDKKANLSVEFDTAIFNVRNPSVVKCFIQLGYQVPGEADGSIVRDGEHFVTWRLPKAEEEVEYAIERLLQAVEAKEFSPSEFLMVRVPGSRELLQIFAEFVSLKSSCPG